MELASLKRKLFEIDQEMGKYIFPLDEDLQTRIQILADIQTYINQNCFRN